MDGVTVAGIVVGAVLAIGILGVLGLLVARALAKRPDRAKLRDVPVAELDSFFASKASFGTSVEVTTALSRPEVWQRLTESPYLSALPLFSGPVWNAGGAGVSVGDWCTASGTFVSAELRVVESVAGERLSLVASGVSIPLAVRDAAERFTIVDGPRAGTLTVRWEVGGSPKWIGFLPWRWGAPFAKPVLSGGLRHVLQLESAGQTA